MIANVKILIPKLDNSGPANGAKALALWLSVGNDYNVEICETKRNKVTLDKADLVISMCFSADLYAFVSKLQYNFKWISSLRSNIYQDYRYLYGRKGIILAFIHNLLLFKADKVVCMYQSMIDGLMLALPQKIVTISPNLIYDAKLMIDEVGFNLERLVVIGSLSKRKGVADLADLFPIIKKKKLHLVFIGNGELKSFLESRAQHHNCCEYVTFLGFKQEPYSFLLTGDFVLSNSSSEGMSRALMDCVHRGVPVICKDIGDASDFIVSHENGFKFQNIAELAKIIQELTMGTKKLTRVKLPDEYQPKNVSQTWFKILERLLH